VFLGGFNHLEKHQQLLISRCRNLKAHGVVRAAGAKIAVSDNAVIKGL
jgi:hypothetical protein